MSDVHPPTSAYNLNQGRRHCFQSRRVAVQAPSVWQLRRTQRVAAPGLDHDHTSTFLLDQFSDNMSPSQERASSTDRHPKHQHSSSELGRLSVPMWDSSDPERCPPPLPLNPSTHTPGTSPVRANTSATVAAAAQALVERARENLTSQYVTNPPPEKLQREWSPQKAAQHKRLQSLQSHSLSEIRPLARASTDLRSPRSATPVSERDPVSPISSRDSTPTPVSRRPEPRDVSPTKPSRRPMSQPLMLENTPPASDLGVEEGIKAVDFAAPLGDITNAATPRTLKNFESIHSQMLNLTSIANDLQKEMVTLSRRSKDNAADLLHLKNSTKQRDDEIRGSLKEIASGQKSSEARQTLALMDTLRSSHSRSTSAIGSTRDGRSDVGGQSPRTLPRLLSSSSSESMIEENERSSRAAARPAEAGPSTAMLERVIREMATKDGQEQTVKTLTKLVEKSGTDSASTLRSIMEALESIRDQSSKALVMHNGGRRSTSNESTRHDRQVTLAQPAQPVQQPMPNIVNDEVLKTLQRVKDSVFQSGGMTGEVKSLIKELRGEVLGMGREIGRKLDTAGRQTRSVGTRSQDAVTRDELTGIIEDNLADLRQHMEGIIQTRRRESASSALSRSTVDSSEVYAVVKHALAERGLGAASAPQQQQGLDADAILNAVKEAYDAYKPEVEVNQYGLERDEILECLREGLEDYRNNQSQSTGNSFSRDDVMDAVREAMQGFQPPQQTSEAAEIKEEVMEAVRASLNEFKATQSRAAGSEVSRNDVVDAVKEGFGVIRREGAREIEISPEDLEQAIRAGLGTMDNPFGAYGDQVIQSLQEIVTGIQYEFKQYSSASGDDARQILDAMSDGMDKLRGEIESYVDRAQDVTGKDEIISTLHHELNSMRASVEQLSSARSSADSVSDRSELATFIKAEFENLQDVIASSGGGQDAEQQQELARSIEAGFASVKQSASSRGLDDSSEEQLEALKAEFEQLREAVLAGSAAHKDEIMDHVRETMDALPHRMGSSTRELGSTEDMLNLLREDITSMRESMQAPVLHQGDRAVNSSGSAEEIIDAIRHSLDSIRAQMSAEQSESSTETIGFIRDEFENFREALGGSLMLNTPGVDREAIMEAVRSGLEELDLRSASQEGINAVRAELDGLRNSFGNAIVPSGAAANTDEIVAQIKASLDDLKDQLSSQVTLAGVSTGGSDPEALENINSGISGLRGDISRLHDKPVDMTVSYEILDTLKDGLANIRVDLDRLKAGNDEMILAGNTQRETSEDSSPLKRGDIERMEVLLAQLQIKVQAMDQNMQNPEVTVPNAATKDDIGNLESSLRTLQSTISDLAAAEKSPSSGGIAKDDIDAIETLLQNTKAKLEEQVIPSLETALTRDHLDGVETVVRMTNDTVETLASKLDESHSSKDDLAGIALLVTDATTTINDIKERLSLSDLSDVATKTNLEAVEDLCSNIKAKIEEMPHDSPTKADVEELNELVADMRDSHIAMKERYESDIGVTAQAFDDRKQEAAGISNQIEDLRGFIEETRDHLKSRMKRGNEDVRALDDILQTIEEKIEDVPNHLPDLEEMRQTFQSEFEKAHNAMDDLRLGHDSNSSVIVEKFEEHRIAMLADIVGKLDERFNEIMASHDDQKRVIGDTTNAINDRAVHHDELLTGTRSMAEDLKVSIDTFGAALSGITPALEEATQKITDDSQTVFGKVEDMYTKLDDASMDSKTNHQLTRDEIARALVAIDSLQQQASVPHPEMMTALKSLTAIVEQSFEHSKSTQERVDKSSHDMKAHFDEGLKRLPVPQIDAPPSSSHSTSFDDTRIHGKLDELLGRGLATHYDDTHVRGKLDELLGVSSKSGLEPEHLERLNQVHTQVMTTAAELSAFMAFQNKTITADAENKSKEADQAALDLSRCLSEKELVEADMNSMKETKESLATDVAKLKAEKDELITRKSHLSADVSSLETALKIRREELLMMDQRADALERRIIEGVMDHSRALLLAKAPRNPPNMNLKRVTSNRSTATASTATPSSVLNAGVDMAIKARADRKKRAPANPSARRIASLNQITSNVPAGGKNLVSAAPRTGLADLKRSQSTRVPAMRKASWHPQEHGGLAGFDKENDRASDDEHVEPESTPVNQQLTKANLARSASYGGRSQTSSSVAYPAVTDSDRRTSYGSTLRSALGPRSSLAASINEESEEEEEEEEEEELDDDEDASSVRHTPDAGTNVQDDEDALENEGDEYGHADAESELLDTVTPLKLTAPEPSSEDWTPRGLVLHKPAADNGYHTDSGLGSELPSGGLGTDSGDYFK